MSSDDSSRAVIDALESASADATITVHLVYGFRTFERGRGRDRDYWLVRDEMADATVASPRDVRRFLSSVAGDVVQIIETRGNAERTLYENQAALWRQNDAVLGESDDAMSPSSGEISLGEPEPELAPMPVAPGDLVVLNVPVENNVPVVFAAPRIGGVGERDFQAVDGWVEAQMRTMREIATDRFPMARFEFDGVSDDFGADDHCRMTIRLHSDVPNLHDIARAARTVLTITLPCIMDVLDAAGYRLRDNVRELYDAGELAYVVPTVEIADYRAPGRRFVRIPGRLDLDDYPLPCRIGAMRFRRDPHVPPAPIWCWRLLSALGDPRFERLRMVALARWRTCRFVVDSTVVPASTMLADTNSFGGGAGAPGGRMMYYYDCPPCTPRAVAAARGVVEGWCMERCPAYRDAVRANLDRAEAAGVSCLPDNPLTLDPCLPLFYQDAGNVALVPVIDVYKPPPHHDEPPTRDVRVARAVCMNRGELLRAMRGGPAVDARGDAFFAFPMTLEEWAPEEHGVGYVDVQSANLLRTSAERVFALVATGDRLLDGDVPLWRGNPTEAGAMRNQRRRTFAVRPLATVLP